MIQIPAFTLAALIAAKAFLSFQHTAHLAPVNPKSYVLDVAIDGASSYQISMWVPFGSTSDSVPGIAHLMEHLKFKSEDGNGFVAFDAIAGSSSNASTTYLTTRYDLNVPASGFAVALETLSQMTKPLQVTQAGLDLEKNIVVQELFQRTQSNPDTPFYQKFSSELYKGFPFENPPIGTQEKIEAIKMEDVTGFDKSHYQASRTFLSITGPALSVTAQDSIEEFFPNSAVAKVAIGHKTDPILIDDEFEGLGAFLSGLPKPTIETSEFKSEAISERATTVKMSISKIVTAPTPWHDIAAARVLNDIINSRLPEGLYSRISDEPRLAQNWSFGLYKLLSGVWQIDFNGELEGDVGPEQLRMTVESYLAALSANGISQASFDRVKARYFLTGEWENPTSRAANLATDSVEDGYDNAISFYTELQSVKLSDVNQLLKITQLPGRIGVALLKPQGSAQ